MAYEVARLDELSPAEVIRLVVPALRVCQNQTQRNAFAHSLARVIEGQIQAAIDLDDLESEFEYVQAKHYVISVLREQLFPDVD